MRNLAIIALLLVYATSQVGSLMIYYYKPVIHAISFYRQQRRMRNDEVTTRDTTISVKQYRAWVREEGEFLLGGILHDIKKITYRDSVVHLQLLEDKHETKWMRTFSCFANDLRKQERSQKSAHQIWNWLFKVYPCDPNSTFGLPAFANASVHSTRPEASPYSFPLTSPGQPPEYRL